MDGKGSVAEEIAAKLPSIVVKDGSTVNITIVVGLRVNSDVLDNLAEQIRIGGVEKRK